MFWGNLAPCVVWDIHPECILKSHEISYGNNICCSSPIVLQFWSEHGSILPCSVQNFKTTGYVQNKLLANKFSRDLRLRWVLDGYPILHSPPAYVYKFYTFPSNQNGEIHTCWRGDATYITLLNFLFVEFFESWSVVESCEHGQFSVKSS